MGNEIFSLPGGDEYRHSALPIEDDRGVLSIGFIRKALQLRDGIYSGIRGKLANRYVAQSASSQIPASDSDWDTYQQARWSAGIMADSIFPEGDGPQPIPQPWPQGNIRGQNNSRDQGQTQDTSGGEDYWHTPWPSPTHQFVTYPEQGGRQDARSQNRTIDINEPAWRLPLVRAFGLSLAASPRGGVASAKSQDGILSPGIVIAPPAVDGNAGNTTRGLSNILGKVQGKAAGFLPGVFTPTEIR